ncbi:hypothetical protein ASPCAL02940 [Aspergillus calidoustus]|uniref:FAD-binding PCMH-type domain-containing protein n=1 Tax=Aspergillus calidoustus TaxID=454130 RepID=A0A0U5GP20_ASPCI|nr:hypothetical protein ASPCAL02940 [Aspergillus calidoustus]
MHLFRFGVLVAGAEALASPMCKCTPKDPCWPSPADFATLNATVSGKLIRSTPPGSVCYPNQPDYNPERCAFVLENWFDSDFHANDPVSIGFPKFAGNPCPPIYANGTSVTRGKATAGCRLGGYPAYVLNATSHEDIQTVVRFAGERNLRLNVKSTGHSVEGRSASPDSISIWTHHLLSNTFHAAFRPQSCPPSSPEHMAISLGAGARVREVYEFAYEHNAVVVGGSAEDVGIVGWFTGGGHGPLTSRYGQGSDNVLQVTIVTPDGELVTANECQNTDLFWAIRGGGGGTFGVITHVTMKAYPSPSAVAHRLEVVDINEEDDGTAFWNAVAGVYALLPELKRQGFAGNIFMDRPPLVPRRKLWWNMNFLSTESDSPSTEAATRAAERALAPLMAYLDSQSAAVTYTSKLTFFPHWFQSWNESVRTEPSVVAASGIAMASRLIPESVLVNSTSSSSPNLTAMESPLPGFAAQVQQQPSLASTIQTISESVTGFQAHLAIYNPSPPLTASEVNRTSLPSYWRTTPLQFFTVTTYPDDATAEEERAVFESVRNGVGRVLEELAPDTGAYFNEGDPYDPDWQRSYFGGGEHYEALRTVKEKVDPQGLLWCVACVGSEEWAVQAGRLCRV